MYIALQLDSENVFYSGVLDFDEDFDALVTRLAADENIDKNCWKLDEDQTGNYTHNTNIDEYEGPWYVIHKVEKGK